MKNLETLGLSYCRALESLPERFGDLVNLKFLYLKYGDKLVALPERFGDLEKLSKLETLNVKGAGSSSHCPSGLGSWAVSKSCICQYP